MDSKPWPGRQAQLRVARLSPRTAPVEPRGYLTAPTSRYQWEQQTGDRGPSKPHFHRCSGPWGPARLHVSALCSQHSQFRSLFLRCPRGFAQRSGVRGTCPPALKPTFLLHDLRKVLSPPCAPASSSGKWERQKGRRAAFKEVG